MARPFIAALPCGCFFQGREMIIDPDCTEHEDADWSCDNCGKTAMDGGDRCVTCGCEIEEKHACDSCGHMFTIDKLDGKPTINSKLRRTRQKEGQLMMLYRAAARGYDFDRLECKRCYGPGYQAIGV